ncbi:tryptophan-rich sensory protein [Amylibacter sp.]|nr:tryptophan-rich sensory protein [Amylibacter sp.]MDB2332172.1 tryptophan-rich sensory protein [Amylibacter sp.]MDB2538104.1 tryptophan-rich sensory protein [Amylibacter sp.]
MNKQNKIITWVVFYLCVTVASSAGFVFPLGDDNLWYTSLIEPRFAPPSWVFAPVWTTLYLLIATSAFRIMTKSSYKMNNLLPLAIALWSLQLALNVIWTPIFSGAQNLEVAFYYIIMLWVIIIAYIFVCWRIDRFASLMMMPYLAWVSFASVLNYYYWQLN